MTIVAENGRAFTAFADPNRLEAHMKELSPADADLITDFCDGIRQFEQFDMALMQKKPRELMDPGDWLEFNRKNCAVCPAFGQVGHDVRAGICRQVSGSPCCAAPFR
ncbi:hypothetical protein [Candidatus Amarobacter glycogenicus]|uniref:hypothetical protein n=1 Tax=Candidatus Amarobacter glycogenicus TaxID=3140699 RepID=UPI002A0BF7C2|nr:hypothetical protein [Dehalococcoidia bacterium]